MSKVGYLVKEEYLMENTLFESTSVKGALYT